MKLSTKNSLICIAAALAALLALARAPQPAFAGEDDSLWTVGTRVNIRNSPPKADGEYGKKVDQVEYAGVRLDKLEGPVKGWFKIRYGSTVGWMVGDYLRRADAADNLEPDQIADLDLFVAKVRRLAQKGDVAGLVAACADDVTVAFGEDGKGQAAAEKAWSANSALLHEMTGLLDQGYIKDFVSTSNDRYDGSFAVSPPDFLVLERYEGRRFVFVRARDTKYWRISAFVEGD